MSAPCSGKAKGPEPLGSSPFRWCEWGDLNSMDVVSINHDVVETLILLGNSIRLNHVVLAVLGILLPICYRSSKNHEGDMRTTRKLL